MITDPLFYFLAVPAVLMVGISKAGFGGGIGSMAVPLMALSVSPIQAAAVLLPILCAMDVLGLKAYWGRWDRRNLAILVPAAMLGIVIGTATFRYLDADAVRVLVGALAVGFTVHHWLRALSARHRARRADVLRGTLWGTVCGFASFVAHAAGPPLSIYLLPQRLDKTLFVGTTVALVFLLNFVKLAPYAWIGQFTAVNLYTSLVLLPLAPIGIWLGLWLHRRAPEAIFYRVCYALLFVVGLRLLYDGAGGMLSAG